MEDLKNKILEIEKQFKMEIPRELRDILFLESRLLENGVNREFRRDLSLLSDRNPTLGNHQYKLSDYQLSWEKGEKGLFQFTLLNKSLNRKLPLRQCPKVFFREILDLMPRFIEELHLEIALEN